MNPSRRLRSLNFVVLSLCVLMARDIQAFDEDCPEAMSTAAMRTCLNKRYQAADAELNQVYQQLSSKLSKKRRERLKGAQGAWLVFRDKSATFAASAAEEGTMSPVLEISELTAITKQRVEQLRGYSE